MMFSYRFYKLTKMNHNVYSAEVFGNNSILNLAAINSNLVTIS